MSTEFKEMSVTNNSTVRDTLGIMVSRWKGMKEKEKSFYSELEQSLGENGKSKKSKFIERLQPNCSIFRFVPEYQYLVFG